MALENAYEHYFEKGRIAIDNIINMLKASGKKIAVWGAGQRGAAFLNVYDPHGERIDYVYDRNEKRYGTRMQTGQMIVDYRKEKADIILIMNNAHEMEVKETLLQVNIYIDLINIDHIILGNLDGQKALEKQQVDLEAVREVRVAAVTILYNPSMDVYNNIMTYVNDVDMLYVYDNSDKPNRELVSRLEKHQKLCYIASLQNVGLPKAINEVAGRAISQGMDWLITFDQDSQTEKHMIERMVEFAQSKMCDDTVGIIAPNITREEGIVYERYYTYFDKVYQSGAMHNLTILEEVGGYDESLFIDQVDYEYCIRMRLKGYNIIKINYALLKHNMQDDDEVEFQFVNGTKMVINKYSSARYYYICRNNLYLFDKYKQTDPVYAHECEDNVIRIKKNAEVDLDIGKHKAAIDKAYRDYKNGVMGKLEATCIKE